MTGLINTKHPYQNYKVVIYGETFFTTDFSTGEKCKKNLKDSTGSHYYNVESSHYVNRSR